MCFSLRQRAAFKNLAWGLLSLGLAGCVFEPAPEPLAAAPPPGPMAVAPAPQPCCYSYYEYPPYPYYYGYYGPAYYGPGVGVVVGGGGYRHWR